MSRHNKAAERAAAEASEAARTLASRGAEVRRSQATEPAPEPTGQKPEVHVSEPGRVEKLLKGRPHSQAMDELLDKREKAEPQEPEMAPEAPKEPEAVATAPEATAAPEAPVEAPEKPKTIRAKVDGVEFDAPAEEVEAAGGLAAYQREKAAENRLKAANEALAEVRKAAADWAAQQKAVPAKPEPSDEQFIAERVDKIRFGTPEEFAATMREILERGKTKVDPNQLTDQVANRIRHDQAVQSFDKEFQDIATNPILLRAAISMRNERMATLKGAVDWENFYRTIGNEIRGAIPRGQHQPAVATQTSGTTSQSTSEKEARKASITTLPTAAARAELPKEAKELTPDEERKAWIAEQKKARGLG